MRAQLNRFWGEEEGAVTVDWVVLTGAIVAVSILAITSVYNSTKSAAEPIGPKIVAGVTFE